MIALATLVLFSMVATANPRGEGGNEPTTAEPTLATPPRLVTLVPAEVPPGTPFPSPEVAVTLGLDVGADGKVEAVRLLEGAGEPFDGAALAAARKLEFEPGRLTTGEAVPVTLTFRMRILALPVLSRPAAEVPRDAPVRMAGRLLERGTRRPLAGVAVAARSGDETLSRATTGPDGRFDLSVPATSFLLVARPADHQPLDAKVDARPGEEREETFYLESTGTGSETVVRASPVRREITRQVIPADEVAKVAGTQGDTLKAVLDLPGVARTPFGFGLLILRGSAPEDTRVFVDGQDLPILYHFGGLRSTIPARFLESVDFVPGNFAPDYGRALGGVIEVKLRDPADDMLRGEAHVSLYDAGVAIEGPLGGGWTGAFGFERSWIDTILAFTIPKDANVSFDTAPRYYDYQFMARRKLGDGTLRLLWYGSLDKVEVLLKQPSEDPKISGSLRTMLMFHALQAHYESRISPAVSQESSAQLTFQRFRTQLGPEYYFDLDDLVLSGRTAWSAEITRELTARAGIDVQMAGARVSLDLPDSSGGEGGPASTQRSIVTSQDLTLYDPATFAELRWEPLPGLSVLPGVRLDWDRAIRRWSLDPRIGARWEVTPGTVLKAAYGVYQQAPQPQESNAVTGNPGLLYERALQASAGVEHRFAAQLEGDVTIFHKRLDRLVVNDPAHAYDPGIPAYTSDGTGRVYGVEAVLRARFGETLFGWVAYTFQRSFRTDGFGKPEVPFDFDQPHNLTAVSTWQLNTHWSLGGRFRLVSGNPSTPIVGSVYDTTSGTFVPRSGPVNSTRLAPFHQLDVRVDYVSVYKTWKRTVFLDVQNVYNRGNQEGWQYRYDYAERAPITGLPILPILGVQGEW